MAMADKKVTVLVRFLDRSSHLAPQSASNDFSRGKQFALDDETFHATTEIKEVTTND